MLILREFRRGNVTIDEIGVKAVNCSTALLNEVTRIRDSGLLIGDVSANAVHAKL